MDTQYTYYYPTEYTERRKVVLDCLDRFLFKESPPIMRYYCPYTGALLNTNTYEQALYCARDSRYETTDHTPIEIEIDGIRCLYVSLDNSVRANINGHSLSKRLENICKLVNTINPDIVFFSEACRKSFEGSMTEQNNVVYWLEMKQKICFLTNMIHCCDSANNFDVNEMSFGVAMFAKAEVLSKLKSIQPCNFLPMDVKNECFGSGAVVITTKTNKTIVAVHFPLDFKRTGTDNNNGKALRALIELLEKYNEAYAFGDMNTIRGNMWNSMVDVLKDKQWNISEPYYTYIGSYFDYAADISEQAHKELTTTEINSMPLPK